MVAAVSGVKSMANFWQEYKNLLRGYIAKRVRDADAVDDLLQEVYLKAHMSLHTLKAKGSIVSWLFRITANAMADHYRSRKPADTLPDELVAPESEPDPVAELAVCLRPLIVGLPERYRSALVLSELEGLPQREVATRLGISLSGAKSRVQRGREKLRESLLECCDVELRRGRIADYAPRHPSNAHGEGDCG